MRHRSRTRSGGFTLPEVLVVVTIIAALAAAVIPNVVQQVDKGSIARVGGDLETIQTAVQQFVADVHRYPASVGQLTNPIATTMHWFGTPTSTFSGPDAERWHGAYINKDSLAALPTGFNQSISPRFSLDSLLASGDHNTVFPNGTPYLVVTVAGIDTTSAVLIDAMFDDGNTQTGMIRWRKSPGGGASDTLKFLATPIQR